MNETLPCRSCGAEIIAYQDDPYVATLTGDPVFPYFMLCPDGEDCFFNGDGTSTRAGSLSYNCCGHTLTSAYKVGDNLAAVSATLIAQCQNSYASECAPATTPLTPILPGSTPLYFNNTYQGPPNVTTIPAGRFFGTTQHGANNPPKSPGLVSLSDLPSGSQCLNTAITLTINASGSDASVAHNIWAIDDSLLPPGMSSSNVNGVILTISGSPSSEGTYPFMVTFTAPTGATVTKQFSLTVWDCTPIVLSDLSPSESFVGDTRTFSIVASGPIIQSSGNTWTTTELPTGLTSSNTGGNTLTISGTPTDAGTFYFTASFVMPSGNHQDKYYTLVVDPVIALSDLSPSEGYVGETHTWTITASGPTIPTTGNTWTVGTLPPGLTSSNTGGATLTITGTLTTSGTFPFSVMFTMASSETVTKGYSLKVDPAIVLSSLSPSEVRANVAHSWSIVASGPTIATTGNTWTVATLPPGLTSSNTGGDTLSITGSPTLPGTNHFTVTFTMPSGESASTTYALIVDAWFYQPVNVGPNEYDYAFNGVSPPVIPTGQWTLVGSLPPSSATWDSLAPNEVAIAFIPDTLGTYSFKFVGTTNTGDTVNLLGQFDVQ